MSAIEATVRQFRFMRATGANIEFARVIEQRESELGIVTCWFCGQPEATDTWREEDHPEVPCCADDDACHERRLEWLAS